MSRAWHVANMPSRAVKSALLCSAYSDSGDCTMPPNPDFRPLVRLDRPKALGPFGPGLLFPVRPAVVPVPAFWRSFEAMIKKALLLHYQPTGEVFELHVRPVA